MNIDDQKEEEDEDYGFLITLMNLVSKVDCFTIR